MADSTLLISISGATTGVGGAPGSGASASPAPGTPIAAKLFQQGGDHPLVAVAATEPVVVPDADHQHHAAAAAGDAAATKNGDIHGSTTSLSSDDGKKHISQEQKDLLDELDPFAAK
ncbi:hypothetical protein CAOG_02276 [Capsaspora owczarzaki ATCC 30864]|uniref:Uncharacterized protein n=1 Tax=Capsaspora owczarzaki (strain ATCC 30864) TaxID=595528 RepID=A0A0D2WM19_CAPO3|nr:hypothetical protein CAOG_02276 [Capsaspora owczarzaki ATCC 30864]KJE91088.1 hypothetical protein CAOG_002276 [Capsaspora owczarzaki ATCC 30864]|eukprot:XP_004349026.1 hypothetical protein CAOG_02276 [Capsaspora owczarzaki ATCC 30864]